MGQDRRPARAGALGDITVIAACARADPSKTIVKATEEDVKLVVVGGRPIYGTKTLMRQAGATGTSALIVAGEHALPCSSRGSTARTSGRSPGARPHGAGRQNPKKEIDGARARAHAGAVGARSRPSLRLALDMPTGLVPIGGLPKDLAQIVVPPIQPLEHDAAFFSPGPRAWLPWRAVDGLAGFYS